MTLQELRDKLAALTGQATAKRAEIKNDMAEADVKRIEGEHVDLLRQVDELKAAIAKAEKAEREAAEAAQRAQQQTQQPPAPAVDQAAMQTMVREAQTQERARVAGISALAKRFGQVAFGDEHAAKDTTVEVFRGLLLDKLATDSNAIRIFPHVEMGGMNEADTRRNAAVGALLNRHDPNVYKLDEAAKQYRGLSLLELAREMLRDAGVNTRGLTKDDITKRAFHSTSDFPYILEAVTNKTLRSAYEAYPQTFKPFCRQASAADFKAIKRVQLGEAPKLLKVNEDGEFKRGTITEGRESYSIATYGRVVGITRQVVINDDLGAFTRLPGLFGNSIAQLESDTVWAIITSNPAMADGKALFNATAITTTGGHGNLISVGGGAPSVTTLSATRKLIRLQKGLDQLTALNLSAKFILVPSALETGTEQLLTSITPAQTSNVVPQSMRTLTPIVEPRLDDNSTTAWYLVADPATIDTIEFAYLDGQEGAFIDTRMGFDVDGMEIKCRLDFGAAVLDWRGLAKNPGA